MSGICTSIRRPETSSGATFIAGGATPWGKIGSGHLAVERSLGTLLRLGVRPGGSLSGLWAIRQFREGIGM
jgi:hypothetical protein